MLESGWVKQTQPGNLIVWEFSFYSCGFRVHNQYDMVNSLWNTTPLSPPCEGGERGVVLRASK
ncbi:MAG: hypothetical protein HYW13_02310 [Planctomycetes bacterium]|nr:hypothetical protein [Planctomycetota bacterium]